MEKDTQAKPMSVPKGSPAPDDEGKSDEDVASRDWVKWWTAESINKLKQENSERDEKRRLQRWDVWKWAFSAAIVIITPLAGYFAVRLAEFRSSVEEVQSLKQKLVMIENAAPLHSLIEDSLRLSRLLDQNKQLALPTVPLGTIVLIEAPVAKSWQPLAEDPDNAGVVVFDQLLWAKVEKGRKYLGSEFGTLKENDPLRKKVEEVAATELLGPRKGNERLFVPYLRINERAK